MRLKEIKPGMAIHCKNDEEKKALLEEAARLGYLWRGDVSNPAEKVYGGNTIHFHAENEFADFKHIAWSDKTEGVTEFSDLILPELTAEEVIDWLGTYYNNGSVCNETFGNDYSISGMCSKFTPKGVVEKISKWKSDHEKKEPEIETVDICRIIEIQPDGRKRCVHEETIEKPITWEVEETLKRYCMEHEGEFIAVHEVVSRVKRYRP